MKTKISRVDVPDGLADHLYYAGEDIEHNDLCFLGVDGLIYRIRNAIDTYPPKESFDMIVVKGIKYEPIDCGVCHKRYFVDTCGIPERGCWTCPYCTGLTIDSRVKTADVIKKKFDNFSRKMQDALQDMQRQVDLLEGD